MCLFMLEAAVSFTPQRGLSLGARWNSKLGQAFEGRPAAMQRETLEVASKHGRRLNCKTKVTAPYGQGKGMAVGSGMVEVKQEADDVAQHLQELNPAEMEAIWFQVKQEIKEEMEAEAWPSSAAASVEKEVESEVRIKKEPVDAEMPKRRRLIARDLRTSAGLLDPVAVKKEAVDQTEVKQEACDTAFDCKQELTAEEMEAMWLEVKQEIKEEMEAEVTGAGQAADVSGTSVKREVAGQVKTEVKVKQELLEEGNQDGSFHDSQCKQPADPATPKRRRLTRRDLETPAKQAMDTAPAEQETSKQVKVKHEVKTELALEQGAKLASSKMDSDWLEVKQEVSTDMGNDDSLLSMPAGIKREVNFLVTQSSAVPGITVKREREEDEMPAPAKGVPQLSAVKEEDRVCFRAHQGKSASLAPRCGIPYMEVLQDLPCRRYRATPWMPLRGKLLPGPSSAYSSGLPRPGLLLGAKGVRT